MPATANNEDGWIEHDGGECPVDPDTCVHFRTIFEKATPDIGINEDDHRVAGSLKWEWVGDEMQDITAYRVVQS